MAMNDFNIGFIGSLDGTKSKNKINQDIDAIKKSLKELELKAKIDSNQVKALESQLNTLKVNLTDVTISQNALNGLVNQINNALKGIQIPNINIGGSAGGGILGNNVAKLEEFRKSLSNIGMSSADIDAVAQRIERLNVDITSLNQSLSHTSGARGDRNLLNIEVGGIDKFGQAVKLTQTWDMDLRELVKDVDAVSSATQKAGSSVDNFVEKQKKAVTDLTNKLNKYYREGIDQGSSKPIKDQSHLSELKQKYDEIVSAIGKVGTSSKASFGDEQNSVNTLISDLQILIKEYKNAETVATSLRSKDISTVKSEYSSKLDNLVTKMKSSGLYTDGFQKGANNLSNILNNATDASGLTSFLNGLDKLDAGYKRAKVSAEAFNQSQKVGIKVSGLQSKIDDLQRISPEIEKFKTQINGAEVSVQSLCDDLSKVSTQSDLSVVNEKWRAFRDAAKAAGIAVTEVATNSQSLTNKINKIQLSMAGKNTKERNYDYQIDTEIRKLKDLGFTDDEVTQKVKVLTDAQTELKRVMDSSDFDSVVSKNKAIIESDNKRTVALNQVRTAYGQLKNDASQYYNLNKQTRLSTNIQNWLSKNSRASKEAKDSLNAYYRELSNGRVSVDRLNYIESELKKIDATQRGLGKLGKNLKDQFAEAGRSFTQWLSVSSGIMLLVSKAREAVTELKEVDSIMTEITKTADQLSESDLSNISSNAFDKASKYGKKAPDYLTGVQEMYRAGYSNAEDLAELSTLAQAAGNMEKDLANDYLIATDAAYKLKGNTEALNAVLDGQNYITNRNALSMQDLAEATKIAASQSASSGISVDKATAAMGTMIATTRQGGDVAARAWKGILMNIQQVEGEVADGEIIDADSLSKYEKACDALGVSLKEVKNGVISLRDPMQILKELSEAYTSLDEFDARRTNLISAVGGKYRGNQLNALLENWNLYEKMLKDYAEGSGSALEEAMKSANNWEGSMNRLGNTFTKTMNNLVNSKAVITVTNSFNGFLEVVDKITSKLGSLGTIGLGAGIFAGFKNVGRDKMYSLICYLF